MRFKEGDRVSWCGVPGRVVKDWKYKSELAASLEVEFEAAATSTAPGSRAKQTQTFMYDGRLHAWHREPSLKMLEREI